MYNNIREYIQNIPKRVCQDTYINPKPMEYKTIILDIVE